MKRAYGITQKLLKREEKMKRKAFSTKNHWRSTLLTAPVIFALLAILLLPGTGFSASKGGAKTLKIGYLLCVSGWYSLFDGVEERHVKIVADMINEQGGLTIKGE